MTELTEIEKARIAIEYGIDAPQLLVFDEHENLLARVPLKQFVDGKYDGSATILRSGTASYGVVQFETYFQMLAIGTTSFPGQLTFASRALHCGDNLRITRLGVE